MRIAMRRKIMVEAYSGTSATAWKSRKAVGG